MVLNKQWMSLTDRTNGDYRRGVESFLEFAFDQVNVNDSIRCLCNSCRNTEFKKRIEVKFHLFKHGILSTYTFWHLPGEIEDTTLKENDDEESR